MKRWVSQLKQWFQDPDLSPAERTPEQQSELEQAAENLSLFYFPSCPFCRKVLREMERLQLVIECRNIQQAPAAREALLVGGGRTTVPCLRIRKGGHIHWLYESSDIVRFLRTWASSILSAA